jgi:hypothetical protein
MLAFLLILLPISVIQFIVGVRFWRGTIIGVFAWLLIEGAMRKWVLPQYQAPILLLKDFALMAAYAGYLIAPKNRVPEEDKLKQMKLICGLFALYCVIEILNPNLPNVAVGLYGLKNYLMYIPLIFIIPQVFQTRQQLNKFLFWAAIASIPVFLLALYQFTQPPTAWINQYVSHEVGEEAVASRFGEAGEGEFRYGRARVASTFSYLSGLTTYLLFMVPLLGGMLLSAQNRSRATTITLAALVLGFGAVFTTGSRSTFLISAIAAPLMIFIGSAKGILPRDIALRLGGLSVLFALAVFFLFGNAAEALLYRAQTTSDSESRFLSPFVDTIGAFSSTPLFGMGVGSNSNAAGMLGGADLYWLKGSFHEVESARIMQDLGLAGFTLFYYIKFYAIFLVIGYLRWSRSKLFISLHMAVLISLIPHIVLFTVNNPTGGLLNWAMLGLSVAIHRIERAERRALARPQPPQQPEPVPRVAMA